MTDEITLPLLPSVAYIVTDPASTEHGLWCERHGPYDTNDMQAYARAAVLLDRQQRPAPSAEPVGEAVARVVDNGTAEGATEWLLTNNPSPVKAGDLLYTSPPHHTAVMQMALNAMEAAYNSRLHNGTHVVDVLGRAIFATRAALAKEPK